MVLEDRDITIMYVRVRVFPYSSNVVKRGKITTIANNKMWNKIRFLCVYGLLPSMSNREIASK